jgi:hypothetical protein
VIAPRSVTAIGASLLPFTVMTMLRVVPSALVTVKVSVGAWPCASACTFAAALASV